MSGTGAKALAVAGFLAAALAGCYLPARFDAEIEITKTAHYTMTFEGYLADVPFYDALRQNKISAAEETQKVERLKTDFTRDSAVKEFSYFKQGHFKVVWTKSGDLLQSKMVSFVRRNENLLSVRYVKTSGQIIMQGAAIDQADRKRLADIGLGMQGELRVKTDAQVVDHNATRVTGTSSKVYVWDIKSIMDPSPRLTIALK